jgi:small-conductance mechanosensitive channel
MPDAMHLTACPRAEPSAHRSAAPSPGRRWRGQATRLWRGPARRPVLLPLLLPLLLLALLLLPSAGRAASAAAAPEAIAATPGSATDDALLKVFNREVFVFRSAALGMQPAERVQRALQRIEQQLGRPGPHEVAIKPNPLGVIVQIDDAVVFFVTAQDVDVLRQETELMAAERAAAALREAIAATRESRELRAVVRALGISLSATVIAFGLLWGSLRARRAIVGWLVGFSQAHIDRLKVSGVELIRRDRLAWLAQTVVMALHGLLALLLIYTWIGLVLAQFPYTRVWGTHLRNYLIDLVAGLGSSIVAAVPGLVTATMIFFLTRFLAGLLDGFFDRASRSPQHPTWLEADVVGPTRRIAKGVLWLFALAMAYPYLPGAHTEAFKGLSVLIGLMLSIGSSNLVGHAGSGLILTYSRVYRRGEYVRIADHEGTVTDLGVFATRLRTGLGEEVTLSNSLVLGAVTKNYSRAVKGPGFVVDTTVTIGYDTPWRQVHTMLVEAATRTPGVLTDPAPQVFQTALSDFYPEYRLVCQAIPSEPRPRAVVLSTLHAHIQDVFNEHGVQIMSPHYLGDPSQPKLVPPAQWHAAPMPINPGRPADRPT